MAVWSSSDSIWSVYQSGRSLQVYPFEALGPWNLKPLLSRRLNHSASGGRANGDCGVKCYILLLLGARMLLGVLGIATN